METEKDTPGATPSGMDRGGRVETDNGKGRKMGGVCGCICGR